MMSLWSVILFYKYIELSDPDRFAGEQRELCVSLGLKGRLLIAHEGINGTLAGPPEAIDAYVEVLHRDPRFADVAIKISSGNESTFPKLVVKVRKEIVTLGLPDLAPSHQNQLPPSEWKR